MLHQTPQGLRRPSDRTPPLHPEFRVRPRIASAFCGALHESLKLDLSTLSLHLRHCRRWSSRYGYSHKPIVKLWESDICNSLNIPRACSSTRLCSRTQSSAPSRYAGPQQGTNLPAHFNFQLPSVKLTENAAATCNLLLSQATNYSPPPTNKTTFPAINTTRLQQLPTSRPRSLLSAFAHRHPARRPLLNPRAHSCAAAPPAMEAPSFPGRRDRELGGEGGRPGLGLARPELGACCCTSWTG
jgi:hypothetical protein